MPPRCSICAHPDLGLIDGSLLNGSSQASVARAYGCTPASIQRHVANGHISELLTAVTKRIEQVEHSDLLSQSVGLFERSLALLTELTHAGQVEARIKAAAEVRKNLELLARLAIAAPPQELQGGERLDLDQAIAARILSTHAQRTHTTPPPPSNEQARAEEYERTFDPPALLEANP